jgi:hypothetical protein
MSREDYLITKFGSVERYNANNQRVADAAAAAGLDYQRDLIKRQPNTIDCHRLIAWSDDPSAMKQRLLQLYFAEGGDLSDREVLVAAAVDCGLDAAEVRRRLASDEDVARIEAEANSARRPASKACRSSFSADCWQSVAHSLRNTLCKPWSGPLRSSPAGRRGIAADPAITPPSQAAPIRPAYAGFAGAAQAALGALPVVQKYHRLVGPDPGAFIADEADQAFGIGEGLVAERDDRAFRAGLDPLHVRLAA